MLRLAQMFSRGIHAIYLHRGRPAQNIAEFVYLMLTFNLSRFVRYRQGSSHAMAEKAGNFSVGDSKWRRSLFAKTF